MKRQLLILFILACCLYSSQSCQNKQVKQNEKRLSTMNDSLKNNDKAKELSIYLGRKGIKDKYVLRAIAKVPRHIFVPENLISEAYEDKPLPIGKKQTISQPYTVAFQTELLQIKPNEKVLEIGTGSGYQAAILCEMGAQVFSIERHQELHINAKEKNDLLSYKPMLFYADGYEGLPNHAPFDKILITAATEKFPPKLLEQLKIGGLMVAPIGDNSRQIMTVIKRLSTDKYQEVEYGFFAFVPMLEGTED